MNSLKNTPLRQINGYTPAKLTTGKRWYIEFYCFHPEHQKLHRVRVSVPHIKKVTDRKAYAKEMEHEINTKLKNGYNHFLLLNKPDSYTLWDEVCNKYFKYLYKCVESEVLRPKTYNGYTSCLKGFMKWNSEQEKPIHYVYQFTAKTINDFLDYLWIEKSKSARTRDNYLMFLKTFVRYLLEKDIIHEDPTANISKIQGHRKMAKNRTIIPHEVMFLIKEWCQKNNRHFLLACYILYYCFVRPREMSYIKISDISVQNSILVIRADVAKNKKDAVVTIPDKVMKLMLDLNVLTADPTHYLFSNDFKPGAKYKASKQFGDMWTLKMKKELKLPSEYKFYSLKDTGITDLIRDNTELLAVRDQARHHSLQMTDLYTPLETKSANIEIKKHESYF